MIGLGPYVKGTPTENYDVTLLICAEIIKATNLDIRPDEYARVMGEWYYASLKGTTHRVG